VEEVVNVELELHFMPDIELEMVDDEVIHHNTDTEEIEVIELVDEVDEVEKF
jgi:hypothetical protein